MEKLKGLICLMYAYAVPKPDLVIGVPMEGEKQIRVSFVPRYPRFQQAYSVLIVLP